MEDKIYKITLANGTEINNLRLNGNNFISTAPVSADVFRGACSPVIINDGETDEIHENMELVQVTRMGEEYWFILRDISAEELKQRQLRADVDYLLVMEG